MHVIYISQDVIAENGEKFSTLHNQIVMHTQPSETLENNSQKPVAMQ